jgi:hypothetical protein
MPYCCSGTVPLPRPPKCDRPGTRPRLLHYLAEAYYLSGSLAASDSVSCAAGPPDTQYRSRAHLIFEAEEIWQPAQDSESLPFFFRSFYINIARAWQHFLRSRIDHNAFQNRRDTRKCQREDTKCQTSLLKLARIQGLGYCPRHCVGSSEYFTFVRNIHLHCLC